MRALFEGVLGFLGPSFFGIREVWSLPGSLGWEWDFCTLFETYEARSAESIEGPDERSL
jgi:hypothetical protein